MADAPSPLRLRADSGSLCVSRLAYSSTIDSRQLWPVTAVLCSAVLCSAVLCYHKARHKPSVPLSLCSAIHLVNRPSRHQHHRSLSTSSSSSPPPSTTTQHNHANLFISSHQHTQTTRSFLLHNQSSQLHAQPSSNFILAAKAVQCYRLVSIGPFLVLAAAPDSAIDPSCLSSKLLPLKVATVVTSAWISNASDPSHTRRTHHHPLSS